RAVLSESGRHVVFTAQGIGSPPPHRFRFDLESGELVQLADSMLSSVWPSVSPDARYVAYSDATNVYVWDGAIGSNILVNVNSSGTGASNGHSYSPTFSRDASKVVFLSDASDLTPEDTHGQAQVFVRDLNAGTTQLISKTLQGAGVSAS